MYIYVYIQTTSLNLPRLGPAPGSLTPPNSSDRTQPCGAAADPTKVQCEGGIIWKLYLYSYMKYMCNSGYVQRERLGSKVPEYRVSKFCILGIVIMICWKIPDSCLGTRTLGLRALGHMNL